MEKPKLRPVEAIPIRQGDRAFVQICDPTRVSDKVLIVPQEMAFLLALLDGSHTVTDIQAALMRQFGELVFRHQIEEVLRQLDEALLLDSSHFHTHAAELAEAFRRSPIRPPCSAGSGYPASAPELTRQLDGFFTADGGSGRPAKPASPSGLVGLIAPHIDFARGGPSYAHAYKALAERCDADLFLIFGTAHFSQHALFILTTKSFQTPLGTLATNAELVAAMAKRYGRKPFAEELVHKNEHSIEFQAVWLQHVLAGRPVEILPVLCGSMDPKVKDKASPRDVAEVRDFFEAVRDVLRESGRKACVIAGADLAHVGRQFGDEFPLTPQVMDDVERADRAMLAHVLRLDADAFYDSVRRDGNARHVCGAPAIYALLATIAARPSASSGRHEPVECRRCDLLDYRQAVDYDVERAVTFASLALHR